MADDQKAQETPEKKTQDAPMPSAEQKIPQPEGGEVAPPTAGEASPEPKEEGLPKDARERTKREFDKLQTQLREERARREYLESVFQTIQPAKSEPAPVYDPETGLINEQVLTETQKRALEAEQRAAHAEEAVQRYLSDVENRETYAVYPELNPDAKNFDQEFHNLTSSLLLHSMVNPDRYGGKQLSFVEAANRAKQFMAKGAEVAKKEGAQEALEQLTPKEQASLEAVGSSGRRQEAGSDLEALKEATRRGSLDALAERLQRASKQE